MAAVSDAQVGALAMAIVWRDMTAAERVALTGAMTRSGEVLDWSDAGLTGPALDKHSTGGVGDKVSLLLAPIVAACGGAVPMISGRGLGHTGGTLDKLEAIPGYDVAPIAGAPAGRRSPASGCAIVGQTGSLAPADRRLYAVRDATGTVESIPLIVASILSKKLAAGLDALVMDVKVGSGAFLPEIGRARELAAAIVEVAAGNGLPTAALLTDMNQVLGRSAGNAVEVREAIDHLTGAAADARLREVTLALSAELLVLGGVDRDAGAALTAATEALDGGRAAERFAAMVADARRAVGSGRGARPPSAGGAVGRRRCSREQDGVVTAVDVRAVGLAIIGLGGGRARESDAIDHARRADRGRGDRRARSGPAGGRWRWCTRATPTAPRAPPTSCAAPTSSATARRSAAARP